MTRKTISLYSEEIGRDNTAPAGEGFQADQQDGDNNPMDGSTSMPDDSPVMAEVNDEPLRRRIANPKRGLGKLLAAIKKRITPPPTEEQIAAMSEKRRLQMLQKLLEEEAKTTAERLSRSLYELGFAYIRKNNDGHVVDKKLVRFDFVECTEDAIWFHVDMDHWVPGCNSDDLIDQKVINHLSRSVQHKLNVRSSPEAGVWFIVERASGMMGIPVHVPIADMWAKLPPTATGLTVPMGMTQNRKTVFDNIDDMVHVMVAGQTGGGKSTLINGWITTLITRNSPDQVKLLLMDMKMGLEFQFFENLPHLVQMPPNVKTDGGIITDPDQVAPALQWLVGIEARKRLSAIRAAGHRDIKSYNARRKDKMPRIIAIIDEWAQARMGDGGKEAEHELAKALQLLRAAGIHMIVCTQTPSKDVLGVLARSNLPTRVAFGCSEMAASILICGDASAMNLAPAGRCIFRRYSSSQPVQVSWITEGHVKRIVADVIAGKVTTALSANTEAVTVDEIYSWALHENQGCLKYQDVFAHFQQRKITQKEVKDVLKAEEGKVVEVDGNLYKVEPGISGNARLPRRLVAVTDDQQAQQLQPAAQGA